MSEVIYCSQDEYYKQPFGAVKVEETVGFRIKVPTALQCEAPRLVMQRDGERAINIKMKRAAKQEQVDGCDIFTAQFAPILSGVYFYYFDLYKDFKKLYKGDFGNCVISSEPRDYYQLTVFEKEFDTPEFIKNGVFYQIFPDRFFDSVGREQGVFAPYSDRYYHTDKKDMPCYNHDDRGDGAMLNKDYYGGDLLGIKAKLPYLKSLGVNCIYLNPIFEAHANHRYNTANYLEVDPDLGTVEHFTELCDAAHKQDVRIILDGVFSHTGADSLYFDKHGRYGGFGAYNNAESVYRPWYDFNPEYGGGYRSWWGFDSLPEVNEGDPSYRNFICGVGGVIDYWIERGADGLRLDVADELPDDFLQLIRNAIKRHGDDKLLIGEVWEDATNKFSYGKRRTYMLGKSLDGVTNYPLRSAIISFLREGNGYNAAKQIMTIAENYPRPALNALMNVLSTHDSVRAATALAGEDLYDHDRTWQAQHHELAPEALEWAKSALRLAYVMLFTLPGVPCIYYGDEIATQGYRDPFNRTYFDWDNKDEAIRPVIAEMATLRKTHTAVTGGIRFHEADLEFIAYERYDENEQILVFINNSSFEHTFTVYGQNYVVPPMDYYCTVLPLQK